MINKCKRFLVIVLGLAIFAGAAEAALQAVDPGPYTAATAFFPLYYTDGGSTNPSLAPVTLDLCLSKAVNPDAAAAGGLLCNLLPNPGVFDPDRPIVFPELPGRGVLLHGRRHRQRVGDEPHLRRPPGGGLPLGAAGAE